MIEITSYHLVQKEEDIEAYNFQESVLANNTLSQEDKVLIIAILIEECLVDHETPIKMLYDLMQETCSRETLILGAYWEAFCPIIVPNPFLGKLKQRYEEFDVEIKAVIKFIEALNLDLHSTKNRKSRKKYMDLLSESISLYDKFFSPYYYMAIANPDKVDKNLILKGVSKIEKLYNIEDFKKIDMNDRMCFDFYYKRYITRTIQCSDEILIYAEL